MSGSPGTTRPPLEDWLASLGFSRGNPFASVEADQERALLPEFFVDVDGYEQIKGDKTVIVFARRGGGKSALRVVLASIAAPISPTATTLAVEYTDFDALIAKQRTGQKIAIDDHIHHLLHSGVHALLNTVCGHPFLEHFKADSPDDKRYRASRAATLPAPTRSRLAHMLRTYHPQLLRPESLYESLQILNPVFSPPWNEFLIAITRRRLHELLVTNLPEVNATISLLADLNDYPDVAVDTVATPTQTIAAFVHLARMMGLVNVQVLIDRLDEHLETANDPEAQVDILEPLLAHLPLLEMPGISFKFFLSREARDSALDRPTIRRDRLTDQAVTVAWKRDQLKRLLNERLAVYSNEQIYDLVQLCQESLVGAGRGQVSRLLGEQIESEMLQLAQGSPRRLLTAAQLLFQTHFQRVGPIGLLENADWEEAKVALMHKMPPKLRLQGESRTIWVGDREVELSSQEHGILKTLAMHQGKCKREILVNAVWGTLKGVTETAVDQAIRRLREKLGDDSDNPVYIRTERGIGFSLMNYEPD